MRKRFYSRPDAKVLQVGPKLLAGDFDVGVSGYVDQGGEDAKDMYFEEEEFDDNIWEKDSLFLF